MSTPEQSTQDTTTPRPFATFLLEHRKGCTHDELSEQFRELVAAVINTGKPGSLTLKVTVKPTKQEGVVEVGDDVRLAAPSDHGTSIFFVTESCDLSRTDPSQLTFGL